MPFDPTFLANILRCPRSHRPLVREADRLTSTDPATRLQFAVIDGIPDMLLEEAVALPLDDWSDIMRRHGLDPATGNPASEVTAESPNGT